MSCGYERAKFMSSRKFRRLNFDIVNKYYPNYFGTGNNFTKFDRLSEIAYASFLVTKNFKYT